MEINVCVPVLNNYNGLKQLVESCEGGTLKPTNYYIVDNGRSLNFDIPRIQLYTPDYNIGVAKAWNLFIIESKEIRLICNDDLIFEKNTLQSFVDAYTDKTLVVNKFLRRDNSFSMFTISDYVVEKVGLFDETISPNYAYFEDNDYHRRMIIAGMEDFALATGMVYHKRSVTMNSMTQDQLNEHHTKFRLAERNYKSKWGGLPGCETYATPYNK